MVQRHLPSDSKELFCKQCQRNGTISFTAPREVHFCAWSISDALTESGRGNQTHTLHGKEGRKGASKYLFSIVKPSSYHDNVFPWKPNLKPVAAIGMAQRKLLVLKINQAALYLESQPTHSPQKNSSVFLSLIKDSINTRRRKREEKKIPHNEKQQLPFMQPTIQKPHW